jgi:hypothetical protein
MVLKTRKVSVTETAQKLKLKYSLNKWRWRLSQVVLFTYAICHHTAAHMISLH